MAAKTSAFDLYFHHHAKSARSSDTLFSLTSHSLTLPLPTPPVKHAAERERLVSESKALFPHWLDELLEGFNLLFYGVGSKRTILNEFASEHLSAEGHVVVVNGYIPTVGPADILTSLEEIPGILDNHLVGSGAEARAHRVASFVEEQVFLVIHNIDAAQLRTARAQRVLSILASAENVHVVGTVDHINSGLLFPRDQALGRKAYLGVLASDEEIGGRGFKSWAWLWHDLTTFEPYTAELAHRDLTVPPSTTSASTTAAPTLTAVEVTPSAAQHVFASVTTKAQKVFFMLGQRQLKSLEEEGVVRIPAIGMQKYSVPYDVLLGEARDEFVAANDAALRGLLGEFRDHGMVLSGEAETGGGEVLWVPASQDVLKTILGYLGK
ncbi:origin recognition complex, subunit 2 [Rhizoctonia solani]|nr:origin recognition complex, subunit 2 [Rhizoctonia solani]